MFRNTRLAALGALTASIAGVLSVGGLPNAHPVQAAEPPMKTPAMAPAKTPGVGDTASDFTLNALGGGEVRSNYRRKRARGRLC